MALNIGFKLFLYVPNIKELAMGLNETGVKQVSFFERIFY